MERALHRRRMETAAQAELDTLGRRQRTAQAAVAAHFIFVRTSPVQPLAAVVAAGALERVTARLPVLAETRETQPLGTATEAEALAAACKMATLPAALARLGLSPFRLQPRLALDDAARCLPSAGAAPVSAAAVCSSLAPHPFPHPAGRRRASPARRRCRSRRPASWRPPSALWPSRPARLQSTRRHRSRCLLW